jgi:DNA processing protein
MKINELTSDYGQYLQIIHTIARKPKRLWYIGDLPTHRISTVAVIGSRKPTRYGVEVAHKLAYELASREVVIVSGLALGIDAIAHRAALEAKGTTIAIMPCGLDRIHPMSHRNLAIDIIRGGGALVSEYEPGSVPYQSNFVARNRIVAGISDAVIVIEATAKSGTMHTAGFALEQGKSVMAVPGNITSVTSEGCNNLIRSGATPITCVADVLAELGLAEEQVGLPLGDSREEQAILTLIAAGEHDGEDIQKQSGLSPALFSQTLTMLEISGKIRALGANQWTMR